jgi:putative flippase GtrA
VRRLDRNQPRPRPCIVACEEGVLVPFMRSTPYQPSKLGNDRMRRLLRRFLQRLLVVALGVVSVWLIVFVVQSRPWILAVALTYAIAAYIVLPYTVRMGLKTDEVGNLSHK